MLMMIFNTVVYAEVAVDVEETNWAEPYIRSVVESDVMPLYENDLFKPSEKVTKMEVLNVIYKIAILKGEVTSEIVDGYLDKYQSSIDGLLIPSSLAPYGNDNHRAIAYAVENGILRTSELSFIYSNGTFLVINKVDASVYMGKALNVYLEENVNKFYEIRFIDGGEITLMAWPYVNLLIEKDIISKSGNDGYFNPNSEISRDIYSVYTDGVLSEIADYVPGEETESADAGNAVKSTGKISIIHYDKNLIEIRDAYNQLEIYDVTGAELTLNGQSISIQNLDPNLDVEISTAGKKLLSLDVIQEYDTIEGEFSNIGSEIKLTNETFRAVEIKTGDTYENFKSLNSLIVERDFQTSDIFDLKKGDKATFYYKDQYVKKIVAFSEDVLLEGVLQRSSDFNEGDTVRIMLNNDKLLEQTIIGDIVKINIDEEPVKGDIVKVRMSNGVITSVEATGLSTEANGRITEIVIGTSPTVTIINNKGNSRTYNISSDVLVRNLGIVDNSGMYALRLDHDVTFELSGLQVDTILINKAVEKAQFKATIVEIYENINVIKAKDIDNKVWIVSLEGTDQYISDFELEDDVFIYGVELSQDLFEADLIIVLD